MNFAFGFGFGLDRYLKHGINQSSHVVHRERLVHEESYTKGTSGSIGQPLKQ
jgi:hypothetical protein